jgi:NADH-quinone oxidoreductase subunit G
MEFLLVNHPLDCPVCDQAGECYLQDYSFRYGRSYGRFNEAKIKQPKKDVGENIVLYADRCILCSRCVRFTQEISGGAELGVMARGSSAEIDVYPGRRLGDKLAGNVADICPVGALLDKQFLFKQRVWDLRSTPSVCPRCSRGCNIWIDHNQGVVWRLRPRFNGVVNGHWMCDEGRYGYKFVQADERLLFGRFRQGEQGLGGRAEDVADALRGLLAPLAGQAGVAAVLSPAASCQEQWLLAEAIRQVSPQAILVRGPVWSEGQAEVFKNGFTISPEKVPNRRGAQAVLQRWGGRQMSWGQLVEAAGRGELAAIWVQGGYPWRNWCPPEMAQALRRAKLLIVDDILPGPLTGLADAVIAGAAWTEKPGSFINDQELRQEFAAAVDRPGGAVDSAAVLWHLAGRAAPFDIQRLDKEMTELWALRQKA